MKLKHLRSGKQINLHNPILFLAQDRGTAEDAYAGDIIGLPNHGNLHIGDAMSEGEALTFIGIPSFAPELLQRVAPDDPMKAKHLGRALQQLAEEGAASVFKPRLGANWYVGVVGALQFEVLADRIAAEYELPVHFEDSSLHTARWVQSSDEAMLKRFADKERAVVADDHEGDLVFLARNAWHLDDLARDWPDLCFAATKDQTSDHAA
jgi:peptide chain release factor 3